MRSRHCTTVNSREQPSTWNGAEPRTAEKEVAVVGMVVAAVEMVEVEVVMVVVVVVMVAAAEDFVVALEEEEEEVSNIRGQIMMTVSRIAREVR